MAKKLYGGSIEVTPPAAPAVSVTDSIVNIPGIFKVQGTAIDAASIAVLEGVTASSAELNILDGVTATAGEVNLVDNVMATATIAYAASVTTDGLEATITVKDAAGATIAAVHSLHVYISRDATGATLTSTAASGTLTAATGEIQGVLTAKKSVIMNTADTGIAKLLLVDSANTAGERFCVVNPLSGKIIVGAACVGTDYEGGV